MLILVVATGAATNPSVKRNQLAANQDSSSRTTVDVWNVQTLKAKSVDMALELVPLDSSVILVNPIQGLP